MYEFKFSYQIGHFQDVFEGIDSLGKLGYDAAEIVGLDEYFTIGGKIRKACEAYGMKVSDVNTLFFDHDLSHPDQNIRKRDISYMKTVVDFAVELGAKTVVMNPTRIGKFVPLAATEDEYKYGSDSIREIGEHAAAFGVKLAVEAWNRYDTYFINNVDKAKKIVDMVGLANVGVMLDTFHLNIEEPDMVEAIKKAGRQLYHLHAGDSNRLAPGMGHIDFRSLMEALRDINYGGYITMEVLPATADVFYYIEHNDMSPFTYEYPAKAIEHLRSIATSLQQD